MQWLTAGRGIVHAEMFPLLDRDGPNPLELFQIWLNLPAADKLVDPYFTMFWDGDMPVGCGARAAPRSPSSPARSASATRRRRRRTRTRRGPDADVAIWHIRLDAGATWTLPAAAGADTVRVLYVFEGDTVDIAGTGVDNDTGVVVDPIADLALRAGDARGRDPGAAGPPDRRAGRAVRPVRHERPRTRSSKRSPTTGETQFGGWPWSEDGPTHGRDRGRFAKHVDGRVERPPT